jgi:hypothetical protein
MIERSAVVLSSGRLVKWRSGGAAHVDFDARWVLKREESRGDIAGFFHTHPAGFTAMSSRDRCTMAAWAQCFGRPLLCAIRCGRATRAWLCDKAGETREATSVKLKGASLTWTP